MFFLFWKNRSTIDDLGYDDGIFHVTLNYGFNEPQNIPTALEGVWRCHRKEMRGTNLDTATYYISKFETDHVSIPHLSHPLERLFVSMKHSETNPSAFTNFPSPAPSH
jgi:KUP system potassium uptake protein